MDFKIKNKRYLNFFKNKKILITGNTGFVGTNISIAFNLLGAQILGYSLKKKTRNIFQIQILLKIKSRQSMAILIRLKNILNL